MPIQLKRSLTSGSLPTTASLVPGELALNVPDGRIFLRKSGSGSDTIQSAITTGAQNSGSIALTGSLSLYSPTGSVLDVSGDVVSIDGDIIEIAADTMEFTGSFVNSGSLRVIGNSVISGSLNVSGSTDAIINGLRIGRGSNNQIENTVVGDLAFVSNLTGTRNTAVGFEALYSNSTGRFNTAYGMDALYYNSVGQENVAIGYSALQNNRSGSFNTILGGSNTAYEITSGSYNTILGTNSGRTITIGNNNTIIGGRLNNSFTPGAPFTTTMSDNVILGDGKGYIRYRFDGTKNNFYDNTVITGSVTATLGFTGSLFGSATLATTASFALVAALDELQATLTSQVFG